MWIFIGIISLVLLVFLALYIPPVQNFVKNKAVSYLKKKTKTEISLGGIHLSLPKKLVLDDLYIQDLKGDTLLFSHRFAVDVNLTEIFSNKIEVKNVELEDFKANIYRIQPDTTFNFQFLADAFMSEQKKPEPEVAKDSTSTLKFAVNRISLKKIMLSYRDDVSGNDAKVNIGSFETNIKTFDLEKQVYVIKNLDLNTTSLSYVQKKPLKYMVERIEENIDSSKTTDAGKLPLVEVQEFNFGKINLLYDDQIGNTNANVKLGILDGENIIANLTKNQFNLGRINLKQSDIKFSTKAVGTATQPADSAKTETPATPEINPMTVVLSKLVLENNNIQYDNNAVKPVSGSMDFNHILINALGVDVENFTMKGSEINVALKNAAFKEKSGFQLQQLAGLVRYTNKEIDVQNLVLKTPNTTINNATNLKFNSLDDLTKSPQNVQVYLKLSDTKIGLKDAGYLTTAVPKNYLNQNLYADALVTGKLDDMLIEQFNIRGLKQTNINISGKIKGLPNVEKSVFDININRFATSKADINALAPKGTIPATITLPNFINANGFFRGGLSNFNTRLNARTDLGAIDLNARMSGNTNNPDYTAVIKANNLNVGRIIQQPASIGKITLNATIKGKGTDPKTARAVINGTVNSAYLQGYNYKNLKLSANYAAQKASFKASMTDPNIDFNLDGKAAIGGRYPAVSAKLNLRNINLLALKFVKEEMTFKGNLVADVPTADADYLNADINLTGAQLSSAGTVYNLDTLSVIAKSSATANSLNLKSEILSANLNGKYQLTKLADAFKEEFARYYDFGKVAPAGNQKLNFDVTVYHPKIIKEMVPSLKQFNNAYIRGKLDTQNDSLVFAAEFPKVIYNDFDLDSIRFTADNSKKEKGIEYALLIKQFTSPSISLFKTELSGAALNNQLTTNLFIRDQQSKNRYTLGGIFNANDGNYKFSFDPDKLLLNYQKWVVSTDNYLQYGKDGILANNFAISNSGQVLSINSTDRTNNSPIEIKFNNFKIETLTSFAKTDSALAGGTINGNVIAANLTASPVFEADLNIDALRYQKDVLGDLSIKVNNKRENTFDTDIRLTGGNELQLTGSYFTAPESAFDLNLNITKIDLSRIESLSGGQIKSGKGNIVGDLKITGNTTAPVVRGTIGFKDAGFNVAMINSYFRLPNESISFKEEGIVFNNFTLIDSLNNKAVIKGAIYTKNYTDFRFGLDFSTRNFRAINSTAKDNELFYGTVYLDSDVKVRGDLNEPQVDAEIGINKGTKFFVALPNSDPAVIEQEGIVKFIDQDAPPYNGERPLKEDTVAKAPISGFDLSADISIDTAAEFNVIVDQSNGDALNVRGRADLNATIDPSGKTSLTGRYELVDGGYNLTVGPLKRAFKIQRGSTLVFTGEPTDANVDITAIYNTNTAPIDLVAAQIAGQSQSEQNRYKEKLDFSVLLTMRGELLKPTLSFALGMAEQDQREFEDVYVRIKQVNTDENELNKQVFALLALNRFIADNPFQSLAGGGGGVSTLARQSVSKLLTEQLNNLASDLVKGVDLNFNLNSTEDYSTGEMRNKTDLNVGLSKRLLNDRLQINVGSNFGLEGPTQNDQKASNIAGDVSAEYKLSTDGTYKLRAYRRNKFEGVVEGEIIETGLGFLLTYSYDEFKEIFKRASKEQREANKQRRKRSND